MRLWHKDLISILPKQWLMGQHRECCALRGLGWGRTHSTVNYVFNYNYVVLFSYHLRVMNTLVVAHGVKISKEWFHVLYRGRAIGYAKDDVDLPNCQLFQYANYAEHDSDYLAECVKNLEAKGVIIDTKGIL